MNNKKFIYKLSIIGTSFGLLAGLGVATSVSARTIRNFDVTIPAQGSMTTGSAKKVNTSSAVINVKQIGGKKTIKAAIRNKNSDITSIKKISKPGRYYINYKNASSAVGKNTTLALSTPVSTVVQVHASGYWSPDAN